MGLRGDFWRVVFAAVAVAGWLAGGGCSSQEDRFRAAQAVVDAEQAKLDKLYEKLQEQIHKDVSAMPIEQVQRENESGKSSSSAEVNELSVQYKMQKLIVDKAIAERDAIILKK